MAFVDVLRYESFLPFITSFNLLLDLERDVLNLEQDLLQILLTPQLLYSDLVLTHQQLSYFLLYLAIIQAIFLNGSRQLVDFFDSMKFGSIFQGIKPKPVCPLLHFLVKVPMFLQISLEFLIIELYDLQLLLGQHFRDVIEMMLNTFDQSQHFLLQVLLPLFGLLQLIPYLFYLGTYFQFYHFFPQFEQCLSFATDHVLLAVSQCATQAYALSASKADVGRLIEVKRTLPTHIPH